MSTLVPTTASVTFTTNEGPLIIDLWAKEIPKTCRSFLEHCIAGIYNGASISQGDDAITVTSTTDANDKSIANEFHSRLRFGTHGLLYTSQQPQGAQSLLTFHITSSDGPDLHNKANLFGRVNVNSNKVLRLVGDSKATVELVQVTKPYFDDLLQPSQSQPSTETTPTEKPAKRKIKMVYDEEDDDTEAVQFKIKPLLVKKSKPEPKKDVKEEPKQEPKEDPKDESKEEAKEESELKPTSAPDYNDDDKINDEKEPLEVISKADDGQQQNGPEENPKRERRLSFEIPNKDLDLAEWEKVTDLSKHRFRLVKQ